MATSSEVKAGLDRIAAAITESRTLVDSAKARLTQAKAILDGLPTEHSDVLATVGAYTPTGAFEELSVDELAKMTEEFTALGAAIDAAVAEV